MACFVRVVQPNCFVVCLVLPAVFDTAGTLSLTACQEFACQPVHVYDGVPVQRHLKMAGTGCPGSNPAGKAFLDTKVYTQQLANAAYAAPCQKCSCARKYIARCEHGQ